MRSREFTVSHRQICSTSADVSEVGVMAWHWGTRTSLGIDLGSTVIKVAELIFHHGAASVRAAAAAQAPPGAIRNGHINDVRAVGQALRQIIAENGIRTKHATVPISGQATVIREVRMPGMPFGELRKAIRFELDHYLPYPIDEATYDVFVAGTDGTADGWVTAMAVAARTDVLTGYADSLRAAGVMPVVIDAEPLTLARAMWESAGRPRDRAAVYVHTGAEHTVIVISHGEVPRVVRSIAAAGADPSSVSVLATEVRLSIDYYGGHCRGPAPERVVLTGGAEIRDGLGERLTRDLDTPVEIGDPLAACVGNRQGGSPRGTPALAVAVGAALRGADGP